MGAGIRGDHPLVITEGCAVTGTCLSRKDRERREVGLEGEYYLASGLWHSGARSGPTLFFFFALSSVLGGLFPLFWGLGDTRCLGFNVVDKATYLFFETEDTCPRKM